MRTLLFRTTLFVAAQAVWLQTAPAEMLFVELFGTGIHYDGGTEHPMTMTFGARSGRGIEVQMGDRYTTADSGKVIEATPAQVAAFNNILTIDGGFYLTTVQNEASGSADALFTFGTPHVPQLGFGLAGYQLTRITQAIHIEWRYEDPIRERYYNGYGSQVIRIYGDVAPEVPDVPELSTWLLAMCGLPALLRWRR